MAANCLGEKTIRNVTHIPTGEIGGDFAKIGEDFAGTTRLFECFALGGGRERFVGFDAATRDLVIVALGDMNNGDLVIGVN